VTSRVSGRRSRIEPGTYLLPQFAGAVGDAIALIRAYADARDRVVAEVAGDVVVGGPGVA
jgi:hypothetical protein